MRSALSNLKHVFSTNNHTLYQSTPTTTRSVAHNLRTPSHKLSTHALHTNALKNKIFKLKYPLDSANKAIHIWAEEGREVKLTELRWISQLLVKAKRYKHAHEVLTWMDTQKGFQKSAADHVIRVEVITNVRGLAEAEEYYRKLRDCVVKKAACLPLLHGYVKERDIEKAEAFMVELNYSGLLVNAHPFNEMMKLYMALSLSERVGLVIKQMKKNKIPLSVLSYNLWMNACGEISDVRSAEKVYQEMLNDKSVKLGWSTLCTLANIYAKAGLVDRATMALKYAENMLSTRNRLGYFFLITLYASVNNKNGVLRLWEASKAIGGRITTANYMCILLSLVKLGDLVEAERIFIDWESNCRKYDIRVSNILLGAYMRSGLMDKAESFHLRTLEKGGFPNYKTWEILVEGWVKSHNINKAIDAMKKGFSMLKDCNWKPPHCIVMAIAKYYEKCGNIEDAHSYISAIHHLGLADLSLYKLLLRMHLRFRLPSSGILSMMEKDGVEIDVETSNLLKAFNCD